jgi:hypothetical protein
MAAAPEEIAAILISASAKIYHPDPIGPLSDESPIRLTLKKTAPPLRRHCFFFLRLAGFYFFNFMSAPLRPSATSRPCEAEAM